MPLCSQESPSRSCRLAYEVERRPFYITRDGVGKPITALLQRP